MSCWTLKPSNRSLFKRRSKTREHLLCQWMLPLTVSVVDENEFFPELESRVIEVPHGTTNSSLIARLTAPDGDSRQTVTMRIKSGDVNSFVLDGQTGDLRFRDGIIANRTQKAEYSVIVKRRTTDLRSGRGRLRSRCKCSDRICFLR